MPESDELWRAQIGPEDPDELKRMYAVYVWRQIRAQRRRLSENVTLSHELESRMNATDPNSATHSLIRKMRAALRMDEVRLRDDIEHMVSRFQELDASPPEEGNEKMRAAKASHD
jgi:hypothetical protein